MSSATAKISITLKAGGNTADPWIVIHADSVAEASSLLHEMVKEGVFPGVKSLSDQFQGSPATTRQAVENVKRAFPGAEVVSSDEDPWAGTDTRQELPASQGPTPCPECNGPRQFKSGTGKQSGKPYSGYFCSNRDHKPTFL